MRTLTAFLVVAVAVPLSAQSFQKHHFTGGLGAAIPQKDLETYYRNGFSWSFGYGYRPFRYLQLDIGLDSVYNAADVNDYFESPAFGPVRIRDFQFLFPYGARAVLPLAEGRLELYGGGGGAYMRYTELLRQPSQFIRLDCPVCSARSGTAWYAMTGASFAVDRAQHFRVGAIVRVFDGHTDGRQVGALPPVRTNDRWMNVYGTFTFSF